MTLRIDERARVGFATLDGRGRIATAMTGAATSLLRIGCNATVVPQS